MFFQKQNNKYILRLEKGERLNESIVSFAKTKKYLLLLFTDLGRLQMPNSAFLYRRKKNIKKESLVTIMS